MEYNRDKKIILDSSVWIAQLLIDDSQHNKAVTLFENITNKIYVPEYVLVEVTTLLKQKGYLGLAKNFLLEVIDPNDPILIPSDQYFTETQSAFLNVEKNNKLSFIDTSLLVLSKDYTVVTFDKQLQKEIQKIK